MSQINRIPRGLHDLLGNTAMGQNPATLIESVSPVVDLFGFWAVEQTDWTVANVSWAAVFQQSTIRVPDGELWIPLNMSCDVVTTVIGESITPVIGVADEANLTRCHLASAPDVVATTATQTNTVAYTWSTIQILTADQYFYAQCQKFNAAAARTVGIDLRFVRLQM